MKTMSKMAVMASVCALAVTTAQANVVSWNLNNYGDAYGTQSTDVAGVVSASNWNDSWLDGRTTDLLDNTGAATTMDIATDSNSGTWAIAFSHAGTDSDGSYNKEILNGYLNGTGAASASVTLSEIPYGSYDIYVYVSSDGADRTGTVTDGTTTYSFGVLDGMIAGEDALFVQTTDATGAYPEANYAVFSGLSGDTQTLSTEFASYGGIAAVQVVEVVPEPATIGLVAVFGAGLVAVRRRMSR